MTPTQKRRAFQQAPAHIRAKSDLGIIQKDGSQDKKMVSSHRIPANKFSLLFAQKLSPDESKPNSARNHLLETYGSQSSSVKVKRLLHQLMQTHKRKWTQAPPTRDASGEEPRLSDRRVVHIRREAAQPKRDPSSLVQSGLLFPSGGLHSGSNTRLDLLPGSLTQSATNITSKKIVSAKMNLVHHLDAVRDVRFMSEHEIVSASEVGSPEQDHTIAVWDLKSRKDKMFLPNQLLRGHLTPILSLDKECYDISQAMFYTGGVDGIFKAWKSNEGDHKAKGNSYEQFASFRVSSEPIWEISSCPFAVRSAEAARLSHLQLRLRPAVDLDPRTQAQALGLQAGPQSHRHPHLGQLARRDHVRGRLLHIGEPLRLRREQNLPDPSLPPADQRQKPRQQPAEPGPLQPQLYILGP